MIRAFAVLLAMLIGFSSPAMAMDAVIEQLRLQVPAAHRELWLQAEARTWQPWLERQDGFEQRSLYWDPMREEGVLLMLISIPMMQWITTTAEQLQIV